MPMGVRVRAKISPKLPTCRTASKAQRSERPSMVPKPPVAPSRRCALGSSERTRSPDVLAVDALLLRLDQGEERPAHDLQPALVALRDHRAVGLLAQHLRNRKYFNADRGVTYYNFTSDQFTGFHAIVIPGTLRDSMYILDGLLEHQTQLRPIEVMADTAGVSDVVFGLFWLLGYQFSPRLADIGEARFWRLDPTADYGVLNTIARAQVHTKLIKRNWDDLLRVAGSLQQGRVSASELMRSILRSKRPSTLARAIGALGRIPRTLYMLSYIDDEHYRRRILTQLNRGEGRHSVARAVFHGQRGELRQRYREGQEDQLGALGLVVNAIVLWNTMYMEAALNQLRAEGMEIKPEDVARLSPLIHKHINFQGRYSFALSESVARGGWRPLRDPYEQDE